MVLDIIGVVVTFVAVFAAAWLVGPYLHRVFNGQRVFLSPVVRPVERGFYWLSGIEEEHEQSWVIYLVAMLVVQVVSLLFSYVILRLQDHLPLNPMGLPAVAPDLAFNTAVSFTTNTNWQNYTGEQTMSYLSQMLGLTIHNFLSAATGIALAVALVRAIASRTLKTIGNFYVDTTRAILYVLLPISIAAGLVLASQGAIQTLASYPVAHTLEGAQQTIAVGPFAFQEAIKDLGNNGGGPFNANSAHPFENPNGFTNNFEIFLELWIPFGLAIMFGRWVGNVKQGLAIGGAMALVQVAIWLWFTVLFANFAEAVAEGRGKAQAANLRRTRSELTARRLSGDGEERVAAPQLRRGDRIVCEAGDLIPGDGTVVEGIASVDESAITGESAPVIREAGGDRSAVTAGTRVLSDRIVVEITANPGETFLDRMIGLVESASRRKTPNEIALNILLAALTIIFMFAVVTLQPFAIYAGTSVSITVLIALLVCLIPTTIGALLSAIGIAGIDRLLQRNVVALSGRAVEAAGDVDTLLLDKTGTITFGNRQASEFVPAAGVTMDRIVSAAALSSLSDETPEGRSIVTLASRLGGPDGSDGQRDGMTFVPFSATSRMSGVDFAGGSIRKGAADSVAEWARQTLPEDVRTAVDTIARSGGTPLVVAENRQVLGTIHLKDIVKPGIAERFAELRRMGLRTVMITGDNRLTAASIAREAGVDDFLAESTPEDKLALIRREQDGGRMVAMTGDGTNDAPALAQADVAVAMNSGTQAAKEAGNLIDLDSDPTKLIEIVEAGKQMLITRGALTTFSIANDVAKYFAIIPAIFLGALPALGALNVMRLANPSSAVLSAVIFNALVIVALIPLALRGVRYRPLGAAALLRRNLLVYGVGGIVAPFAGIKLIDLLITAVHLA